MLRCVTYVLLVLLPVGSFSVAAVAEWRIVPLVVAKTPRVALPPLAVVESRDDSGKTWRVTGKIAGSPSVARRDFTLALERQGWRLDKVIALGRDGRVSDLCLWKKEGQTMMLMLSEEAAGKTRFAFGVEK